MYLVLYLFTQRKINTGSFYQMRFTFYQKKWICKNIADIQKWRFLVQCSSFLVLVHKNGSVRTEHKLSTLYVTGFHSKLKLRLFLLSTFCSGPSVSSRRPGQTLFSPPWILGIRIGSDPASEFSDFFSKGFFLLKIPCLCLSFLLLLLFCFILCLFFYVLLLFVFCLERGVKGGGHWKSVDCEIRTFSP